MGFPGVITCDSCCCFHAPGQFRAHPSTATGSAENIERKCEVGGVSREICRGGESELKEVARSETKVIAALHNAFGESARPRSRAAFEANNGHVRGDAPGNPTAELRRSSGVTVSPAVQIVGELVDAVPALQKSLPDSGCSLQRQPVPLSAAGSVVKNMSLNRRVDLDLARRGDEAVPVARKSLERPNKAIKPYRVYLDLAYMHGKCR